MTKRHIVAGIAGVVLAGVAGCWDEQGTTHRPAANASVPPAVERKSGTELLPGSWQTTITPGVVEVWTFSPLFANGEGPLTVQQYQNGVLVSKTEGRYKWNTNPLLPESDRVQLRMMLPDVLGDLRERTAVVRSLSDTTLVLASLYLKQEVRYQRLR
jgi:hypothetical protein